MTETRSMARSLTRGVAVLVVVGLALGAGLLASEAASDPPTRVAAAPAAPAPRVSPAELRLAEWPGLRGDLVRDEVVYAEEYRAREQLIRSCMREHGFTYVPIPLQYGPTASGFQTDPNARIVSGLAPVDRRAYHLALANTTGPDDVGADFDLDTAGTGRVHR